MRRRSSGPGAPSPGNSGGSRGRSPGPAQGRADTWQRRLAPPSLGLLRWGGAGTAEVAVAGPVKPGGARPATHLSGVGRRAGSAPALRPSSCGPRRVAGAPPLPRAARVWQAAGTGRGWEGIWSRASAHATLLSPRSLPRRRSRPRSRPRRARASGEQRGDPGPAAARARAAAVAGAECRPHCALAAPALRSGTELGGAQRSAHCSLAFRKATLAAGRRDAGLTHARARVSARLWGRKRGSDGRRRRRRGWAGRGRGANPGAAS